LEQRRFPRTGLWVWTKRRPKKRSRTRGRRVSFFLGWKKLHGVGPVRARRNLGKKASWGRKKKKPDG